MVFHFLWLAGFWAYFAAGTLLAASIISSILMRPKSPSGDRLSNLSMQVDTYGQRIKDVYGTVEVGGQVLIAKKYRRREDGKEGYLREYHKKLKDDSKYWVAYATFAIGVCAGEIDGITRIKANGKVIYNARADASIDERNNAKVIRTLYLTMYRGTVTQKIDTTLLDIRDKTFYMDNVEVPDTAGPGAGIYGAHRGLAYVVFKDFPLMDYGNQIPQFLFEVSRGGTNSVSTWEELTPAEGVVGAGVWTERYNAQIISYNDKLRLVAGQTTADTYTGDIWSSLDGSAWSKDSATNLGACIDHRLVEHGGSVVIQGGYDSQNTRESLFFSASGIVSEDRANLFSLFTAPGVLVSVGPTVLSTIWLTGGRRKETGRPWFNYKATYTVSSIIYGGGRLEYVKVDCGIGFRQGHFMAINDNMDVALIVGGYTYPTSQEGVGTKSLQAFTFDTNGTSPTKGTASLASTDITSGLEYGGTPIIIGLEYWNDRFIALVSGAADSKLKTCASEDGVTWVDYPIMYGENAGLPDYDLDVDDNNQFRPAICVHKGALYVIGGRIGGTAVGTVYVASSGSDSINRVGFALDDLVTEVCATCDLSASDIDVTQLAGETVDGFVIASRETVRRTLEDLSPVFFWDTALIDDKITFVLRGAGDTVTIDPDDLGMQKAGGHSTVVSKLEQSKSDWQDYPRRIDIKYISYALDYDTGMQMSLDPATSSSKVITAEIPMVLSNDKAIQVAKVLHDDFYLSENKIKIVIPIKYLYLTPTDILSVTVDDIDYTLRINEINIDTDAMLINCDCSLEDITLYAKTYAGLSISGALVPSAQIIPDTIVEFLDISILDLADDNYGMYVAVAPDGRPDTWSGCSFYKTKEGSDFEYQQSVENASTMGHTTSILPAPPSKRDVWDEVSFVDVLIKYGTLASAEKSQVYFGANMVIIGDEIIHYTTVTDLGDGTYRLSELLRGRAGTEWAEEDHAIGERVVVLDRRKLGRLRLTQSELNQVLYYKVVSTGKELENSAYLYSVTGGLKGQHPWAPGNLRGEKDTDGTWKIVWRRRIRGVLGLPLGVEALATAQQKYRIEVFATDRVTVLLDQHLTFMSLAPDEQPYFIFPIEDYTEVDIEGVTKTYTGQRTHFGGEVSTLSMSVKEVSNFAENGGYAATDTFTA